MIGLSKSTLEIFQECPRCFWLAKVKKIERPRSPMPGIVNAVDAAMKAFVETAITQAVPAINYLEGIEMVPFQDRAKVALFRSWRTFQREMVIDGVAVKAWGELDDLLIDTGGDVSPWDYKSSGQERDCGYTERYYQLQGDLYHLLLEGQGLICTGKCYFTYIWPLRIEGDSFEFGHSTLWIRTDPKRAEKVLHDAAVCLEGTIPPPSSDCAVCKYVEARATLN